jgi:drug/metabolite transporter (DMT)-like permease
MAFSIFSKEYSFKIKLLIPSIIASLAVIFPHIKKEKLILDKYLIFAFFGSFLFALELALSKQILNYFSPFTFYFLRCFFIFLLSFLFFNKNLKLPDKKTNLIILFTGICWIIYRIAVYIGYKEYGIIFTTTILLLSPILTYVLANHFLKEKLNWKNIVSSIIIVICVIINVILNLN